MGFVSPFDRFFLNLPKIKEYQMIVIDFPIQNFLLRVDLNFNPLKGYLNGFYPHFKKYNFEFQQIQMNIPFLR